MANNNEESLINTKRISDLERSAQDSIDKLYQDIRGNSPNTTRTIDYMRARMHNAVDNIIGNNMSNVGMTSISTLYTRLLNSQNDKGTIDQIIRTFENDGVMESVMGMYSQNVYIKELDKEFEVILKYMPKLYEALSTRKEAVLSADHFTKDSINISSSSSDLSQVSTENNIHQMRMKYDIENLLDSAYDYMDRSGEVFTYCVPYKRALQRLMKNRTTYNQSPSTMEESVMYAFDESGNVDNTISTNGIHDHGINVRLNKGGILDDAILQEYHARNVMRQASLMSIAEANMDETIPNDTKVLKTMYKTDPTTVDGFVDTDNNDEYKVTGCVVKHLERANVVPLYIENNCLGYYYIETDRPLDVEQLTFSSTLGGLKPGNTARQLSNQHFDDSIIKKIARSISDNIDKKFINANQDLTKEIYCILKYNATHNEEGRIRDVKITFIPPEDIIHGYFQKDPRSNRGISSLMRCLFPAKLYSCLYISNVIAILTRSNDKRVYYVKQNVDTNIAAVLLNTINQIKKSNFGLRQIENMNNIMNITGRFNDYVIPESASGDAPVRFEVMQGQDVTHPTELMNQIEEMVLAGVDVPMEVIQARQQLDFATHYTMSNTRFLRKVFNLQAKFTKYANTLLTRIYDAEYDCNDSVQVELPPPMYLNLMNSSQMFQSANEHVENVTPLYIDVDNEEAELVNMVKAKIKKFYLRSFLPDEALTRMVDQARMEYEVKKKENS